MKKYMALLLCLALLASVTACGNKPADNGDKPATTQVTTTTTTTGESVTATTITTTAGASVTATTATTTAGTDGGDTTATTVTVSTTTATKKPTTTVGTQAEEPVGPTTAATTTKKPTTTSTTVVTKPTVAQPSVVLPAIGTDIDIENQKNRIRVSAASAVYNADGTIAVSLTFKNYSSNWITEETDWVEYTCYDKSGNTVQAATRMAIGCIDTKNNAQKTFEFSVPASTAEVRLTRSKIVYWTEWS